MVERLEPMLKEWQSRGQKWFTYFPLQSYLVAFLLFLAAANIFLQRQFNSEPSAFNDILVAIVKLVKTVVVPLLFIGLLTTIIPFFLLWLNYRQRKLTVSIGSPGVQPEGLQQELHFSVSPLWQPLFGQVYFRMMYDKGRRRSPRFSLIRRENVLGYAGNKQEGWYRWPLPGIREYEIDTMVIYMEDFFHFFRLAMPVKVNQSFFTRPSRRNEQNLETLPTKTITEAIRISDWRKVQGEWLNYKHFETNDDVRRIVWKIYARNKELVVRTPEIVNPFASHVSVYLSFFDDLHADYSDAIMNPCLDFYKAACWTLFRQIARQGVEINLQTDQPVPQMLAELATKQAEYMIAVSNWHHKTKLEEFVKLKDATLVCISSLNNCSDVEYLAQNAPPTLTIALVPLSQAAPIPKGWNLFRWLWIETEREPSYRVNLLWFLSPVRRRMIENENKLKKILMESSAKWICFGTRDKT